MKKKRSGHSREKWYKVLCEEEGERCKNCGVTPPEYYLEVDHKDNKPSNDTRGNVQLLCVPCNRRKGPRGKGRHKRSLQNLKAFEQPRTGSLEFQKNRHAEPKFRKWLERMIRKHGRMPTEDVVNGGAEFVSCSQITVRRYLQKLCSITGAFREVYDDLLEKKVIEFKDGSSIGITTDLISQ